MVALDGFLNACKLASWLLIEVTTLLSIVKRIDPTIETNKRRDANKIPTFSYLNKAIPKADNKSVSAVTSIKPPVPIDSLYFGLNVFDVNEDSLGFIYMEFKDPDTIGNAYRIYAKKRMEPFFFSVEGTTFSDQFINGRNFSIFSGQSDKPFGIQDTFVPQEFFYKLGDTVDIRLASFDYNTYDFYNTLEAAAGGNGNPFSAPTIVKSNIEGGLGVWAGLSYTTQTVIAKLP